MKKTTFILFFVFVVQTTWAQLCNNVTTANCSDAIAGTSRFYMSTPSNIDFTFSDMQKYISGITYSGSTQLRLKIDEIVPGACKWKLMMYIDNNNHLPANEWEPLVTYGSSGNIPELDLIQVKVYNGCGTPFNNGVYQIFAGNTQYDILEIIRDPQPLHPAGSCDGTEVNGTGSYLTDYNEFNFTIDYRIIPGFQHRPGIYQITIHFCLEEVP